MPKITMEEAGETPQFTVLPQDALVKVRVLNTSIRDMDGKYGPWQKLELEFEILEVIFPKDFDSAVGQRIWGGIPFRFVDSEDNDLKQWVEALFGLELSPGFELDTDNLIGREAKGVVENYPKKNGETGHSIASLIAVGEVRTAEPAQPQQPVPVGGGSEDVPF